MHRQQHFSQRVPGRLSRSTPTHRTDHLSPCSQVVVTSVFLWLMLHAELQQDLWGGSSGFRRGDDAAQPEGRRARSAPRRDRGQPLLWSLPLLWCRGSQSRRDRSSGGILMLVTLENLMRSKASQRRGAPSRQADRTRSTPSLGSAPRCQRPARRPHDGAGVCDRPRSTTPSRLAPGPGSAGGLPSREDDQLRRRTNPRAGGACARLRHTGYVQAYGNAARRGGGGGGLTPPGKRRWPSSTGSRLPGCIPWWGGGPARSGTDPDFHRRDMAHGIEAGAFPADARPATPSPTPPRKPSRH